MSSSPIRELARRHAAGELSQEEYRARRRDMINEVINGQRPLTYEQHRPRKRNVNKPSRAPIVAAAGIAIGAIVAVIVWIAAFHTPTGSPNRIHRAISAHVTATGKSPGATLVRNFLRAHEWNKTSIQKFIQKWNELPPRERANARHDYRYPRLVSELQQQIISQQAMSDLTKNNSSTKSELASLRQMATTLGVQTQSDE